MAKIRQRSEDVVSACRRFIGRPILKMPRSEQDESRQFDTSESISSIRLVNVTRSTATIEWENLKGPLEILVETFDFTDFNDYPPKTVLVDLKHVEPHLRDATIDGLEAGRWYGLRVGDWKFVEFVTRK